MKMFLCRSKYLASLGGSLAGIVFSVGCQSGEVQAADYEIAEKNDCLEELDRRLNCARPLVSELPCEVAEEEFVDCVCPEETCERLTGRTSGNTFCGRKGKFIEGVGLQQDAREYSAYGYECVCRIDDGDDRFSSCNLRAEPDF